MSDDFPLPPENMLSEQIALPDHRLALGLVHRDGDPAPTIVVWDGERFRHLTPEAARKVADWYDAQPEAAQLAPASDAMRTLARRVDEIAAAAMFRRAGKRAMADFATARTEGNA
jgi:hypothetical protein